MKFFNIVAVSLFGLANSQYGHHEEVSFHDHVWPSTVSQAVQDFLSHHLAFIDYTSGTNETANAESMSSLQRQYT
jgi:alkyl sulfatase BDS1-like metallo-beta-lactamase superfamily hydrolase